MLCKDFQPWLSHQLDEELSAADQVLLSRHLAICDRCAQDWELMRLGRQLCRSTRQDWVPPAHFSARVLSAVRREKAQWVTLWSQLIAVGETMIPAFAMLIVLFLGIFLMARETPNRRLESGDTYHELFVPAEEERILIAERGEITADRVIQTVLEGR